MVNAALENYKALVNIEAHFKEYKEKMCKAQPVDGIPPYERVVNTYELPFPLYPFQQETVNDLAPLPNSGFYLDVGTGKTATSIASFLYKLSVAEVDKLIVIMPPILIDGWYKTLQNYPVFKNQVVIYRGPPSKRNKIQLGKALVTLVGFQIFKNDFDKFDETFKSIKAAVILDEATSIKNIKTQNYKLFKHFTIGKPVMLLTGTPIGTPLDGYAYTTFTAPGLYRNFSVYQSRYTGMMDFFGRIISWSNLEELNENLTLNSKRILRQDVLHELPEVTYTPMFYELGDQHKKLYDKLATEQLLLLEDGRKIDATVTSALYHKLSQIICNNEYYSGKKNAKSMVYELIEEVLEEINGSKLIIFSNYRLTNQSLSKHLDKYGAVTAFGDNSVNTNNKNIQRFINNDDIQILIGQPSSIGLGVDGLQHVCHDMMFLELPSLMNFTQSVARLHRAGQKDMVNVRLAVAVGTIQVRQAKNLLNKDEVVNQVIRNVSDLRTAIFGD